MLYKFLNGKEKEIPDEGLPECRIVRARPRPGQVHAQIVAVRENVTSIRPTVGDGNGVALRRFSIEVAWSNPAVAEDPEARPVASLPGMPSRAKTFSLHDAEGGIPLHSGSKIGSGGPVDHVWVVGKYDSLAITSDVLITGLYSSDITASPEFRLVYSE